jgi:hypothetical protein
VKYHAMLAFALVFAAAPCAHAKPFCVDGSRGECVMLNDPGGTSADFEPFIAGLRASGRQVVIRGDCSSYCTVLADRLRPQVCLAPGVGMHFHKMTPAGARLYTPAGVAIAGAWDPKFSPDVAGWIAARGGLPAAMSSYDTLYMPYDEALRFWRACP